MEKARQIYESQTTARAMSDINHDRYTRVEKVIDRAFKYTNQAQGQDFTVMVDTREGYHESLDINDTWYQGMGLMIHGLLHYPTPSPGPDDIDYSRWG